MGRLVLFGALLFTASCESLTGVEDPCGTRMQETRSLWGREWNVHAIGGGRTVAGFSTTVPKVCVAIHSELTWRLRLHDQPGVLRGGAVVYRARMKTIPLEERSRSGSVPRVIVEYGAEHSLGLKDQYAEDPGEFTMIVEVSWPSVGSLEDDRLYFYDQVLSFGEFGLDYYLPKQ